MKTAPPAHYPYPRRNGLTPLAGRGWQPLCLDVEADPVGRKGDLRSVVGVEGLGAELGGAEIGRVLQFVLVDQVLEEGEDVEFGE